MKKLKFITLLIGIIGLLSFTYPSEKLMDPQVLTDLIKQNKAPLILNLGPTPLIKGAVMIGNAEDPNNQNFLKSYVSQLPKNKLIVIYCGCCKLEDCYNIHEGNKLLTSLGFTNIKILNLPTDFDKDWKEKGYPVE